MAVGLGLAGLLVLALAVGGARPAPGGGGLPGAGPLVGWGLPVVTLAGRIAAVGTVGALLFAAVLLPGPRGRFPAASAAALRAASLWALAWSAATALGAVLTVAEITGVPLTALTASSLGTFFTRLGAGQAALVAVAAAAWVAVAARRGASAGGAAALLAVAAMGLVVPIVLTGHSAAAEDRALAVANLGVHVVCAAVWVGGLLALLLHGRSDEVMAVASRRFSALALACFLGTGASGLLAAWIVLGGSASALAAASGTGYGWLLAGKTAALVALGTFGWHHRRVTLPGLQAGEPRGFRRFAGVEAGVMLATVTLAVALAASPLPSAAGHGAPSAPTAAPTQPTQGEDMAAHDHGELSVTVLVDETRFHVGAPVAAGVPVTVYNESGTEVTITAADGSFDVVVPGRTMLTFPAPEVPGTYRFSSRHSAAFDDTLVVG